jgi:iron complex outermembrane receptor protein
VLRDAVTVVAGVAPNLEAAPAAATTLLAEEDLEQRRPARLVDALESIPGVSRLEEGASGVPVLRGFARGRTLILYDGARVSAERRAGPSATFLDTFSLESVEVARGPGSVAYGSDAFGGVINAMPRDPRPGRSTARYNAGASYGGLRERSIGVEGSTDLFGGAVLGQLHWRDADDLHAGGERVENSAWSDRGGALRFARQDAAGWWRLGFNIDRGRDIGKPATDSGTTRAYYPSEDSTRFTAALDTGARGGWENVALSMYFGEYRLVLDRDRVPTPTVRRRIERSDVDSDDAQLRAVASRPMGGGRLQLGIDASSRFNLRAKVTVIDFDSAGGETSTVTTAAIAEGTRTDAGAFAIWERALGERMTLNLGLRGDQVRSENRDGFFGDRDETDHAVSGQAALVARLLPGLALTVQGSHGFRAPLLSERYFRGPSGRGFIVGNPNLVAETADQFDLALRYQQGRTTLGFFAYLYRIDDMIERYRPASDFFFRNRGHAEIKGLEFEGQTPIVTGLDLQVGAAWARGEDRDTHAALADIAAPGGWLTLRWSSGRASAYARGAVFLHDDRPGPTEVSRPGYATLDAGCGWRFAEALEVRLVARNLTDRRYAGSPDEVATLAPGRNVSIGLTGRF